MELEFRNAAVTFSKCTSVASLHNLPEFLWREIDNTTLIRRENGAVVKEGNALLRSFCAPKDPMKGEAI